MIWFISFSNCKLLVLTNTFCTDCWSTLLSTGYNINGTWHYGATISTLTVTVPGLLGTELSQCAETVVPKQRRHNVLLRNIKLYTVQQRVTDMINFTFAHYCTIFYYEHNFCHTFQLLLSTQRQSLIWLARHQISQRTHLMSNVKSQDKEGNFVLHGHIYVVTS